MEDVWQRPHTFFHQEPGRSCGNCRRDLCNNLFCLEPAPDPFGKIFSNLSGTHEIRMDFWGDIQKLVNKAILKLYLQDLCALIISHGAQDTGFDGLPFQEYHHTLTRALDG
jgi:hypothetical protein